MQTASDFALADHGMDRAQARHLVRLFVCQFRPDASLRDYLGDLDSFTVSTSLRTWSTVKRRDFTVRSMEELNIKNSMENFQLLDVHQGTIGGIKAQWHPVDGAPGNFVILQTHTAASRATLGNDAAFDRIDLAGECRQGRAIHPHLPLHGDRRRSQFQHVVQSDTAPDGPDMARLGRLLLPELRAVGFRAGARAQLPQALRPRRSARTCTSRYSRRAANPLSRPGRFTKPLVHTIDNWFWTGPSGRCRLRSGPPPSRRRAS